MACASASGSSSSSNESKTDESFVVDDNLDVSPALPELPLEDVLVNPPPTFGEQAVELRKSRIKGAGIGLFALLDFEPGDLIQEYYGQRIDAKEAQRRNARGEATHIATLVYDRAYIDGREHRCGGRIDGPRQVRDEGAGAYANSSHGTAFEANAIFDYADSRANREARNKEQFYKIDPAQRKLFVRAIKPIRRGDEILVDYPVIF